jgi:hypothetical protein
MDFLKTMLGNMAEEDGADDNNDEVFEHAVKAADKAKAWLLQEADQYRKRKDYFQASLFLFAATWALVGHMYQGISGTEKKRGKNNMVSKLWHLLRIAFTSGDLDRTMAKLGTFEKDYEEGKFNDL